MLHEMKDKAVEGSANDPIGSVVDMAIVGAGPAGMTAALYAARSGLSVSVFERISPGGQLAQTEQIDNYPGFPQGANGFELAFSMFQHASRFGIENVGEEVLSVDFSVEPKVLRTATGEYRARCVVVATGARPRLLGLPREAELQGRGVSYCATCDGGFFRGKTVAIVGGGNTAAADAIYLSRICEKVYLIHRRDKLRATAIYHKRLQDIPNLEFVWNAQVSELLEENGALSGVLVDVQGSGEPRRIDCSGLFVAIGNQPNSDFLENALQLDDAGYVVTDESCATAVPGVYAAGDVRIKTLRQVVTAVSDGALCASEAAEYLAN